MVEAFWTDVEPDIALYCGDCRVVMAELEAESVDSVVTDPPYELGFMGKGWDRSGIAYEVSVWRECLRVLKPGGHLLAFGGSRTYHRLACAIEDAGFEIRDQIQWLYGSGFPKSLNVSKQIDLMEKEIWLGIKQLIEELGHGVIIEAWKATLSTVELVDSPSLKSRVAVGFNTQRSGSVPANAPLPINPRRLPFNAIIAELKYSEALRSSGAGTASARATADINTEPLQVPAVSVEQLLQNPSLKVFITASIAQCGVKVSLNGNTANSLRDEEALKIWLGKKKCLEVRDIDALCAGLIDGLKLTILSLSKTFQNLDTQSQTECVSAMIVTTTASTAASLISFTVDTLKSIAIDAAAGAEREIIGPNPHARPNQDGRRIWVGDKAGKEQSHPPLTAIATEAASKWSGFGTALKPAHEPIVLARKPLEGTVAQNILRHGTGGLNIDRCRIGNEERLNLSASHNEIYGQFKGVESEGRTALGRWPANVIHDGSDEVLGLFPQTDPGRASMRGTMGESPFSGIDGSGRNPDTNSLRGHNDNGGSAARFFYIPKADKADRSAGLEDLPILSAGAVTDRKDGSDGLNSPRAGAGRTSGSRNHHPTVKPTDLMRYLCRLITPPKGLVLDPFCGSGSTGKAARAEGFRFIGIEINKEYCALAAARCEIQQRSLFGE